MNLRGTLPALILEAIERHPDQEGTLYPALHKLELEGAVESYEEVEKGRTRRYYRLTKAGHSELAKDRKEWSQVSRAVTLILKQA